jgi:2-dehydro-3-deoxygluconokinase
MMTGLTIGPGTGTRYDLVSLGEVMIRLDPGEARIRNSVRLPHGREVGSTTSPAGFGLRAAIVTALANNDIGWLIEEAVDTAPRTARSPWERASAPSGTRR